MFYILSFQGKSVEEYRSKAGAVRTMEEKNEDLHQKVKKAKFKWCKNLLKDADKKIHYTKKSFQPILEIFWLTQISNSETLIMMMLLYEISLKLFQSR